MLVNMILLKMNELTWEPVWVVAVSLEGDDVAFVVAPSTKKYTILAEE